MSEAEIVGEYVDRLCTIEMRSPGGDPRGIIHRLYSAARSAAPGAAPLTAGAAQALCEHVGSGERVLILTGAGGPPDLPLGETDGPLGAVGLARAIHFGLGAEVVVHAEARIEPSIASTAAAAGMNYAPVGDDGSALDHSVHFLVQPETADECRIEAEVTLDRLRPTAVIAVEKLSPNDRGVLHSQMGADLTASHAQPQFLIEAAQTRGILTLGIGDGGNEVGFGRIQEAVREILPTGRKCDCPCGGGTAAAVSTDHLVVAAISNWGAFGVAAMIGFLTARIEECLITPDDVDEMLRAAIASGCLDGASGRPVLCDDGVPLRTHMAFAQILSTLVRKAHGD